MFYCIDLCQFDFCSFPNKYKSWTVTQKCEKFSATDQIEIEEDFAQDHYFFRTSQFDCIIFSFESNFFVRSKDF